MCGPRLSRGELALPPGGWLPEEGAVPCPEGEYTARTDDARLGPFKGERRVTIRYPSGSLAPRALTTVKACVSSTPLVGEPFAFEGAVATIEGRRSSRLFDWPPLDGENIAFLSARSESTNELLMPLSGVRRPAEIANFAFRGKPGPYRFELLVGRAALSNQGAGLAVLRETRTVE